MEPVKVPKIYWPAFTDIKVTFTVPISNLAGHLYGISKGTKYLLAFTEFTEHLLYL